MKPSPLTVVGLVLSLCLLPPLTAIATEDTGDFALRVDIQGDVVHIDADMIVPAAPREVWDVLTDFEHLSRFVSGVKSSSVLSRNGNVVRVAQTSKASFGPFTFEIHSEREQTLTPYEKFESRMISGDMKRFHSITQLEASDDSTRIRYQSEVVPDTIFPLRLVRSLIEAEAREHYLDIRKEVLRRRDAAAGIPQ